MLVVRGDWITAAVKAFRRGGVDAIFVEGLARDLAVTKGSFYWHFKDRNALLKDVLGLWRDETRQLVAAASEAATPLQRVLRFFDIVAQNRGQLPDMEYFAWARRSKTVASLATAIEEERIAFIRTQLVDAGLGQAEALIRAEAAYLATLGWIERSERTPAKGTPAELRRFTAQLFGWCFRDLRRAGDKARLSLPMRAGAER